MSLVRLMSAYNRRGNRIIFWDILSPQYASLICTLLFLLGIGIPSNCQAQEQMQNTITVNANRILGPVNRGIMGQIVLGSDSKGLSPNQNKPNLSILRNAGGLWDPKTRSPDRFAAPLLKALRPGVLRYPGGNLGHGYDWQKAALPLNKRGNWAFGIMEYLKLAKMIGAHPQIQISAYSGTPADKGELVEFLNSPATAAHPWAMRRLALGHPRPYGVKYFELGNEPDNGNQLLTDPPKFYSVTAFINWFKATAKAMRAVDPSIRIGLPVGWYGKPLRELLRQAGPYADFIIIHTYAIKYHSNLTSVNENLAMQACMASDEQMQYLLRRYHQMVREAVGKNLPLAITEYNTDFLQNKPIPFRFTIGAAIFNADYVRILLKPDNDILLANYHQFINDYWGMVRGKDPSLQLKPAYYAYLLWAKHFGASLIDTSVIGPKLNFSGFAAAGRAKGSSYQPPSILSDDNAFNHVRWDSPFLRNMLARGASLEVDKSNGTITVHLDHHNTVNYINFAEIPLFSDYIGASNVQYHITFEARYLNDDRTGSVGNLSLGIIDARGWWKTHSATTIAISGSRGLEHWQKFAGWYYPLPDTKQITLVARLLDSIDSSTGILQIRNIRVVPFRSEVYPAYQALTTSASLSTDGKTLYVIVFNKSLDKSLPVELILNGFHVKNGHYWQLAGTSALAEHLIKNEIELVKKGKKLELYQAGRINVTLPPHSMTAYEFYH